MAHCWCLGLGAVRHQDITWTNVGRRQLRRHMVPLHNSDRWGSVATRHVSIWWRHKWKHFPRYWPFVRGIHRSPVNSPHKGQWRGAFMFSLICAWINGWVNNREAGDLKRHNAHYDVIVMKLVIVVPADNRHQVISIHSGKMLGMFFFLNFLCYQWFWIVFSW